MACPYCNAPRRLDDKMRYQPGPDWASVPVCGTHTHANPPRTDVCLYIEKLRRVAEDMDTALMGIDSGILLGGTHLSLPLEFGREARLRYEELGEFTLPELSNA